LKQFLYGYDQAGNRTSEQIDLGVTGANYNNVNQPTNTIGGGPVRFVGHLDETGTALTGTDAATMGLQSSSFVGYSKALRSPLGDLFLLRLSGRQNRL